MSKIWKNTETTRKPDCMAKVIVLGNSSVGKTSLLSRYTWDGESPFRLSHTPTIGVDFKSKVIECGDNLLKLQLWDTAGQERYRTLTDNYYNGVSGIMLVYSVVDRKSFEELSEWMYQINSRADEDVPKIIVANKCDITSRGSHGNEKRVVQTFQGRVLSEKYHCLFLQVSAKENINVNQAFQMLAKEIMSKKTSNMDNSSHVMTLKPKKDEQKQKKSCCG